VPFLFPAGFPDTKGRAAPSGLARKPFRGLRAVIGVQFDAGLGSRSAARANGKSPIAERTKSKRIQTRMAPSGNGTAMRCSSGRNQGWRERKGN